MEVTRQEKRFRYWLPFLVVAVTIAAVFTSSFIGVPSRSNNAELLREKVESLRERGETVTPDMVRRIAETLPKNSHHTEVNREFFSAAHKQMLLPLAIFMFLLVYLAKMSIPEIAVAFLVYVPIGFYLTIDPLHWLLIAGAFITGYAASFVVERNQNRPIEPTA